jgi:hypothetical protein
MDKNETNMMIKFIERKYPVSRIKDNMRFKRAIILDNDTHYFLGNENSHNQIILHLCQTLKIIFYCEEKKCIEIIKKYLNI